MHAPTILKWLPCVPSRSNSNWSKPCANQYICRPSCHVLSTHCPLLYSNKGQNGKRRWILQKSGTIDNKLESQKASNFSQLKKASCLRGQFNQDLNSTIKSGNYSFNDCWHQLYPKEPKRKVPPRFELGLLDSESNVLATRPWNQLTMLFVKIALVRREEKAVAWRQKFNQFELKRSIPYYCIHMPYWHLNFDQIINGQSFPKVFHNH